MKYRNRLIVSDVETLGEIIISTGFFNDSEVRIVKELVQDNLLKGESKSGYIFNIVEENGKPIAFTCYGAVPGTQSSFDLYWIATARSHQGRGIGKMMMNRAVEDIRKRGGENIWIETASRPQYESTRQFYLAYGCEKVAEFPDFYSKNDSKVTFRLKCVKA